MKPSSSQLELSCPSENNSRFAIGGVLKLSAKEDGEWLSGRSAHLRLFQIRYHRAPKGMIRYKIAKLAKNSHAIVDPRSQTRLTKELIQ